MSRFPALLAALSLLAILLTGKAALAQAPAIDTARLAALYETALQRPEDSYLQSRIEEERARIRAGINQELTVGIATIEKEKEEGDLATGRQRQEKVLSFLEEERQESAVDLSLLQEEEKSVYLAPATATGTLEEYRLTQSHGDLLAKKAAIEERITAIESLLPLQQERLQKLNTRQWIERFSLLIRIASIGGMFLDRKSVV